MDLNHGIELNLDPFYFYKIRSVQLRVEYL